MDNSKLEQSLSKKFSSYFENDNWSRFLQNKFFQHEYLNIKSFDEKREKTFLMLKIYFEHFYKIFPFYEAKIKFIPIHMIMVHSIHEDSYNLFGNNYLTRVFFDNILDNYSKYEEKILKEFDIYVKINFKDRNELLQSFLFTIQYFIKNNEYVYQIFYPLLNKYFYEFADSIIYFSYFQSMQLNIKSYEKLFNHYVLGYSGSLTFPNLNSKIISFKRKGLRNINFIKMIPEVILKELFIKIFKRHIIYRKDILEKFEKEQLIYSFIGVINNEEIQKNYFKRMIDINLINSSQIKKLIEQNCISKEYGDIILSGLVMAEFM